MSAILNVRDENGKFIGIPAIKGDKGERGEKGEKGDTPSLEGYATKQYVDKAIANIKLPEGSGGGGSASSELLINFTVEEEIQIFDYPLADFIDKINNAERIIFEIKTQKPVADDATSSGTITATFLAHYSYTDYWTRTVLFGGKAISSNSTSWHKYGRGFSVISKGTGSYMRTQLAYIRDGSTQSDVAGSEWTDVVVNGTYGSDILRVESTIPLGVGTEIRMWVSGGLAK